MDLQAVSPILRRFFYVKKYLEGKKVSISQLKTGKIWTNWVWHTTKDGKQTKRPLSKVNDPTTWITFEEAYNNTWNSSKGVGIMFAKNGTGLALCGIDIDAHHVATNPLSAEILAMFSDTYIERSPSGKGYHILFFAQLNKLPRKQDYKNRYQQKNSELDVECYISGITNRYFTFTGNQTSESDYVTDKTDILLEFLEKYMFFSSVSSSSNQLKLTEERENKDTIDVNSRLEVALNANNGNLFSALYNGDTSAYNSPSEAVQAFVDILVFYFGDGGESLVKDVYMRSRLAEGKWAERDEIINTTIFNAFQRVSERYTPQVSHQNSKMENKLTERGRNSSAYKKNYHLKIMNSSQNLLKNVDTP